MMRTASNINSNFAKAPLLYAGILLSIPFVVVLIYTHGLTSGIDTIFSIDEPKFHYPTILQFAHQLPLPDVRDYNSATTPLFHILLAIASKITGEDITHLRMVNLLITYITVLMFFKVISDHFRLSFLKAFLFTLLFTFSPYFFREAFVLLTDNLPVLWLIIFLHFYLKHKLTGNIKPFLWSLFLLMLLCLTRQTYLYVWLALVMDILIGGTSLKTKGANIALSIIAIAPTLLLFYTWHGLTPPSFIKVHTKNSLLNVKPIMYCLSVIGFYGLFIPGSNIYADFFKAHKIKLIAFAVLSCLVIYFFPLTKTKEDFGFLWYMAVEVPMLKGTSLLFYFLSAAGVIVLGAMWQKEGTSFFMLFIVGLLLSEVPNKLIFQRYYDSSILVFLILLSAKYHVSNKIDNYRISALIAFFIAYFVVYTIV